MSHDISRPHHDTRAADEIVRAYVVGFVQIEWRRERLPEMYYDLRAPSREPGPRASVHAKCVVADRRRSSITSANFTEAAQERNIEAGVLIDDPHLAAAVESQLENRSVSGAVLLAVPPR